MDNNEKMPWQQDAAAPSAEAVNTPYDRQPALPTPELYPPYIMPVPPDTDAEYYEGPTAAYLRTQIGNIMRVEFLIGQAITERIGRLIRVGPSYIILQSLESAGTIMCDIYSIKFASIIAPPQPKPFLL